MPDHTPLSARRASIATSPSQLTAETTFRPWAIAPDQGALGHLALPLAEALCQAGLMHDDGFCLTLNDPPARGFDALSYGLEEVRSWLAARDLIPPPRDEVMPVRPEPHLPAIAQVDRSLIRPLGLWLSKVHINGVVARGTSTERVWLSLRSDLARSAPGEWDTLVAGGQAIGDTIEETARREGAEEAGLSIADCTGLRQWGQMAVIYQSPLGLHREALSLFDLDLGPDFQPRCDDAEIQAFQCLDHASLRAALEGGVPVKHSSRVVLREWLRRGG